MNGMVNVSGPGMAMNCGMSGMHANASSKQANTPPQQTADISKGNQISQTLNKDTGKLIDIKI